jgi:hypothetical protein
MRTKFSSTFWKRIGDTEVSEDISREFPALAGLRLEETPAGCPQLLSFWSHKFHDIKFLCNMMMLCKK